MPNFTEKILNNSVSALIAQQAVIATAGTNIANVNTPGYTRRVVDLESRATLGGGGLSVGNGVTVGRVQQVTDRFLNKLILESQSDAGAATAKNDMLDRLQQIFSLTGAQNTIGDSMTAFFNAADDLASNPSSIELRTNFLAKASNLVDSIKTTYDTLANLQTEADKRIESEVVAVNGYLQQIAELNGRIATKESDGSSVAADERDQRQVIMTKLAEKINFNVVDNTDGSNLITLPSGFALVSGTNTRLIGTTSSPSFVAVQPPSLSGQSLNYITYDFSDGAGTQHVDLTQQITGGSIGGLLALRGYAAPSNTSAFQATGTLVETAARVESIARTLLTQVNSTYLGPVDRNTGTATWDPSSGDLNGVSPAVFGLFTFTGAPASTPTGLPTTADLNTFLATSPGFSFASHLDLTSTDPRRVAASVDASGGAPAAAVYPQGDGQNIKRIADLQNTTYTFTLGSYTYTGTFDGAYNETVSKVANDKQRAELDAKVATGNLETAQNKRDEVSGVSLDEEFTNLIKFQKAYQAAARMIKAGQDLLDEILRAI